MQTYMHTGPRLGTKAVSIARASSVQRIRQSARRLKVTGTGRVIYVLQTTELEGIRSTRKTQSAINYPPLSPWAHNPRAGFGPRTRYIRPSELKLHRTVNNFATSYNQKQL